MTKACTSLRNLKAYYGLRFRIGFFLLHDEAAHPRVQQKPLKIMDVHHFQNGLSLETKKIEMEKEIEKSRQSFRIG